MIEIDRNPSATNLRWFGIVLGLFLAVVGGIARWKFDAPEVARWIWIAAAALTVVYYAIPAVRRPLWIGWTVSHLILLITWLFVVTPIGLFLRLIGRDLLRQRIDRDRTSYWTEHDPHGDPKRYFRQF
jgi:hypothetical protein